MNTIVSRAAIAALLATTLGIGLAQAQVSPANPNYSYDTRGKTAPWGAGSAYAFAPATHVSSQAALSARATVIGDGEVVGQDPDANVRLQLRKSEGVFDR